MTSNPILEEIYAAREKLLAEHNGNVHAYVEDARQRALASGRPIAAPTQRVARINAATKCGVSEIQAEQSSPANR